MAKQNRTTLKGYFETGDIPTQTQYADLIDSNLNLSETTEQTVAGGLNIGKNITASGNISASGNLIGNNLEVNGNITASGIAVGDTNKLTLGDKEANVGGVRLELNQLPAITTFSGNTQLKLRGNRVILNTDAESDNARIELRGPVTASGNISASGDIIGNISATNVTASGNIRASGIVFADQLRIGAGTTIAGNEIEAVGSIRATGDIQAGSSLKSELLTSVTFPIHNYLDLDDDTVTNTNGVGLFSNTSMVFGIDSNNNATNDSFKWKTDGINGGAGTELMMLSSTSFLTVNGSITASGDISASGTLYGSEAYIAGSVTASGNISSSGIVNANSIHVDGKTALDINGTTGRLFSAGIPTITSIQIGLAANQNIELLGPVTASSNISSSATLIANEANIIGNITASGNISASGNMITTQITASGGIRSFNDHEFVPNRGVVLTAPNGNKFRISVDNSGNLSTTSI